MTTANQGDIYKELGATPIINAILLGCNAAFLKSAETID